MHPLNAVRRRFTAWRMSEARRHVETHRPSPADRATEATIEEAQREAEDEIDPTEQARIETAQREAEDEIDPTEQARIETAQREPDRMSHHE